MTGARRWRPTVLTRRTADDEILFVGRDDHRFLVDVLAAVTDNLLADLADVLEGGRRTGRVEDQDVGGRLSQSAEGLRRRLALATVQIPLL